MRKLTTLVLVLCLLLPVGFAYAEQDLFDLQRRIVFNENDEFYVLTDEGTVFANDAGYKAHPQIREWSNLTAIRVSWNIAVGLTRDGTVLASVIDPESAFIIDQVAQWNDVEQIAASYNCVFGLTAGNTILYAGSLDSDQQAQLENSQKWGHIKYITSHDDLFVLTDDGHVFSTKPEDFSGLDHIVDIVTEGTETVFLKDDGTIIIYTEWEPGIGTFDMPDEKDILQVTYFDNTQIAELRENHEFIVPQFSSMKSFSDPRIIAISGYAWIDNEGIIHMDQKRFGLDGVELPGFNLDPVR